jgi:hypothetical protein
MGQLPDIGEGRNTVKRTQTEIKGLWERGSNGEGRVVGLPGHFLWPERLETCQPRATPWVNKSINNEALKGRYRQPWLDVAPFQGKK